ncbi:MAG: hypothetical protein ACT4NL_08705 [Pseudomarimonas sp.]
MHPTAIPVFALCRATLFAALVMVACTAVSNASANDLLGTWRIVRQQPAPWVVKADELFAPLSLGEVVVFEATRVRGPGVLRCGDAHYGLSEMPAEGLFQGGLPQPAADAQQLGFPAGVTRGLSLRCETGLFEFHLADANSLLFALDNRIYSLSRAPGALAAAGTPEAAVQQVLESHFAADMGFLPAYWKDKRAWLATELNAAIDGYFAAPWPTDEPPPINGDPLTNSQEYPTRFAVSAATLADGKARVKVVFGDAHVQKQIEFLLQRESDQWRVSDLIYTDGHRFTEILAARPPGSGDAAR